MLFFIGQNLGASRKRLNAFKAFSFMTALPAEVIYERDDNVATYRDQNGALALAAPHQPRLDHDENGEPLGLLVEGSRKNELATHNANPTDTSGWITGGDASGVLSVVDAPVPLSAVGLEKICSGGKVFKVDNSAGASSFYVESDVTVGDLDIRSCFAYTCILEGSAGTNGTFGIGYDADQGTHVHRRDAWEKVIVENVTPSATNRRLRIKAYPGQVIHFILPQLEKGAFASSPIITTGAAAIRALDAVYILNLDQKSWWNEAEGFMAVRYSIPVFPPASVYTIAAHNTSAESIGVRVDGVSHAVRGWVRSQSLTRHASSTGDPMTADTAHVMGVTWKPEEATVFSGLETYVRTWPGQSNPSGMNELRIGQRNSGSDPIYGHVKDIAIGKKHLETLADIGKISVPKNDMLLIAGGQSNINEHFNVPDEAARNALIFEATRQAPNTQAVWINGSTGGSAVIRQNTSDPDKWWVDPLDNYAHGPAFDTFLFTAAAAGACFDYVVWAQGEADAHQIGTSQTERTAYKAALIRVFEDMRAALGPVEIYIQFLGTRNGFTNTGGMQAVREVQKELVAEYAWVHFGAEAYDAELDTDEVHYTDAAYIELATRMGRKIAKDRGADIAGTLGPAMGAVTRSGTTVTVNLVHDAGDALNLTAAIEGFHFFDDGVEIPITAATSDGVSEVTLELSSAPTGTETLYYIYDDEYPLDKTKIVKDNAAVPMPLQSGFVLLTPV